MPSKAVKASISCPNCGGEMHEIWFRGNHGEEELLETHCNYCRFSKDSEGNIRNAGDASLKGKKPESKGQVHYVEGNRQ